MSKHSQEPEHKDRADMLNEEEVARPPGPSTRGLLPLLRKRGEGLNVTASVGAAERPCQRAGDLLGHALAASGLAGSAPAAMAELVDALA